MENEGLTLLDDLLGSLLLYTQDKCNTSLKARREKFMEYGGARERFLKI